MHLPNVAEYNQEFQKYHSYMFTVNGKNFNIQCSYNENM